MLIKRRQQGGQLLNHGGEFGAILKMLGEWAGNLKKTEQEIP